MGLEVFSNKRVALVHDWLNGMRGGEKCLEVFCEIFPEAEIFTLFHEPDKLSPILESKKIHTSFIQKLPRVYQIYRHYLPLFPVAIEQFDLSQYDVIFSSSHCVAKGIKHSQKAFHISYVHAPMRYMWDLFDTYFGVGRSSKWVYGVARAIRPFLRRWDVKSSQRVHSFICNSENIKSQVERIYQRQAKVVHPPVDLSVFQPNAEQKSGYYLMVGAFAPNKRVDLAIEAFNLLSLPLKIVGGGQEADQIHAMAKDNIEFLGQVDNDQIRSLYQGARAFVFPGEDDFGITPLEAQASGTPVIAFAKGGALETVTEQTGIFFKAPTVTSLVAAIEKMEMAWSAFAPQTCVEQAKRFSRERFKQEICSVLEHDYTQWLSQNRTIK